MSNIITLDFNSVPAFAKNKSAVAAALGGSLAGGVKRLSIKGGTFRYIVGGQEIGKLEERYIDIVLVNAAPHVSRTFYAKEYDAGAEPTAPDCWSTDGRVPAEQVKAPQAPNCASCPKNEKGSGKNESRACRFNQRLAVVLANDVAGEVLQVTLPATSIFGEGSKEAGLSLQGYVKSLAARGIDPAALITRMKFDTDKEAPTLGFAPIGWLSQEQYAVAIEQGKSESAIRAITMTVAEVDGVDAKPKLELPSGTPPTMVAPAAEPAKPAPVKYPSTKPAATPAPTIDEPVVRKADVQQAPNDKLAKLAAEWAADDE